MAAKRGRTLNSFGQAFTPLSVSGGQPIVVVSIVDLTLRDRSVALTLLSRTVALSLRDRTTNLTLEER